MQFSGHQRLLEIPGALVLSQSLVEFVLHGVVTDFRQVPVVRVRSGERLGASTLVGGHTFLLGGELGGRVVAELASTLVNGDVCGADVHARVYDAS